MNQICYIFKQINIQHAHLTPELFWLICEEGMLKSSSSEISE